MNANTVENRFADLVNRSIANNSRRFFEKTRVTVQLGHCSMSVGAKEIVDEVSASLSDPETLTISGCDGACFEAPVVIVGKKRHRFVTLESVPEIVNDHQSEKSHHEDTSGSFFESQTRIALFGCGVLDAVDTEEYLANNGYAAVSVSLQLSPENVIEEVKESGLRGRGGAYFPAALKWEAAKNVRNTPRFLVVNCEEGEPGIFKDRHLMEGVPHRIIEGAIIAAYAARVSQVIIYINAEAELSATRMTAALEGAQHYGLVGDNILGSGFNLQMEIRRGAGGYVCGEETTLLNTVEGYRREPRLRPPFPTEAGLWSKPTVINNAETLSSIPFIMMNGATSFKEIGTESDPGTKIVSLTGVINRTGIAEVPMGMTLADIIYQIGGGPKPGHVIGLLGIGGPSSGVLPVSMLHTPIKGGILHESGVMLGAGGIIVIDDQVSLLEVARNLASYNANESCGKCTPCREGTPRMVQLLDKIAAGDGDNRDIDELSFLAEIVNAASLCGLGQAAGNPILSVMHFFGDELALLTSH